MSKVAVAYRGPLSSVRGSLRSLCDAVVGERRRTERALAAVARGVSVATGHSFFQSLVEHLAKALPADYAMVGQLEPAASPRVRTIAAFADGVAAPNFEYDLKGTPCEHVLQRKLCSYARDVQRLFPEDRMLVQARIEGYVGTVLTDAQSQPLGLMAVLTRRPLGNTAVAESVLQIFASRAAAELDRQRSEDALRANEAHFRQLAESTSDWVWEVDVSGRYTYVSPRVRQLLGHEVQEVVGRTPFDLMPPEEAVRIRAIYNAAVAEERELVALENVNLHRDGRRVVLETSGVPVHDANGRLVGYRGIDRDITERKQAEAKLREAQQAADEANAAKDRFLATLSHELRTPLMPVLVAAEAMEGDGRLPAEVLGDLAMMRRNVELEARLIDDLLDVTRIARGKLQLRCEAVDVHRLIEHVIAISRASEAAGKGQRIVIDLAAAASRVWADPVRLQQVIWNLLNNALKFTPGSGVVTIRTYNEDRDEGSHHSSFVIEVSDTGMGIDPAVLPRIFEAFEQGSQTTARAFGGLGLGLSISKGLVDMHGGTLTAQSEGAGHGATFRLELPLRTAEHAPATAPAGQHRPAVSRGAGGRPLKLLVVDDHADTAGLLGRVLRRQGYEVQTALSVQAARSLAAQESFDVLISDLRLPDGSGLELMQELRRQRPDLPGIALSGHGQPEDLERSREAGFGQHLIKPVNLTQLQGAIGAVIAG